jgi:ATP-dependent 26S proteasome regulatory subunit
VAYFNLTIFASHFSGVVRFDLKDLEQNFNKTEDDIKALQSVGQIIGEVLKQLDEERCECVVPFRKGWATDSL